MDKESFESIGFGGTYPIKMPLSLRTPPSTY